MLNKVFGGKDDKYKFVTQRPTIKSCPYCECKLKNIPKRKKKCPNCGQYIFVRKGKLYTEDEKDIRDWLSNVEHLGITRKMFNKTREELSAQFGTVASINDTSERILTRENAQRLSKTIAEWEKGGCIKYVIWSTANDSLVCDVCRVRAGKEFPLGEIEKLIPAHKGCRCWISPIVDEDMFENEIERILSVDD